MASEKFKGARNEKERAEAFVAGEIMRFCRNYPRKTFPQVKVSPEIYALLSGDLEWRKVILPDATLSGMKCGAVIASRPEVLKASGN